VSEYRALEGEEARQTAFSKFAKWEKKGLREKEVLEGSGSTTGRNRRADEGQRIKTDNKDRGDNGRWEAA